MEINFEVDLEDKYEQRWSVTADVSMTKDMYATGDSPTGYDVAITHISNGFSDEDLNAIDPKTLDYLEELAIQAIQHQQFMESY